MYDEIVKDFDVEAPDYCYDAYIRDNAMIRLVTVLYYQLHGEEHENVYGKFPTESEIFKVLSEHSCFSFEDKYKMRIYAHSNAFTSSVIDFINTLYNEWLGEYDDYEEDFEEK